MHSVRRVATSAEQREARRRKEAGEIKRFRALDSEVLSRYRGENVNVSKGLEATEVLLTVNPEHYTAWNIRRELLLKLSGQEKQELLLYDLGMLEKLMARFPKVYWMFDHRLWVLDQLNKPPLPRELALISRLLERDSRNFFGWTYRRAIVQREEKVSDCSFILERELEFTRQKINTNFSNFSAWHNRSQLIRSLSIHQMPPPQEKELAYVREAVLMDPQDQSAWTYYRWVLFGDVYTTPIKLLEQEIEMIEELINEEESTWAVYTLWTLYKASRDINCTHLVEKMIELDPMRKNRYKSLLSSTNTSG